MRLTLDIICLNLNMKTINNINIQFYLNDKFIEASATPETTALTLIRENLGLTGAKEVCAEGDCGACTIAFGKHSKDGFSYKAINSCLLPIAKLHGSHVITVEGLKENNKLHLIQETMLEKHAVQCGYCTAGMIMALFCLFINNKNPTKEEILTALEGNICRCTGYKAIYAAAEALTSLTKIEAKQFLPSYANKIKIKLKEISPFPTRTPNEDNVSILENYCQPKNLPELFKCMDANCEKFKIMNGGTDLMVLANLHRNLPKCFIDISHISELNFIEEKKDAIIVGGTVTFEQLLKNASIKKYLPTLRLAISHLASPQIRNTATLAGNVVNASPIADTACALLGLGATLCFQSKTGKKEIPLEEFYHDYKVTALNLNKEIVSKIIIPKKTGFTSFVKTAKRKSLDIATVNSTVKIITDKNDNVTIARIAFGGIAKHPILAKKGMKYLLGKKITNEVVSELAKIIAKEFTPISDVRGSSEYRKILIHNQIIKHFLENR